MWMLRVLHMQNEKSSSVSQEPTSEVNWELQTIPGGVSVNGGPQDPECTGTLR